jgi:predicted transcriptional regulator
VPNFLESLPDAELEVLACLWQSAKATARDIREAMAKYRPMTHGAMVTLLKRLESKGLVVKEKGPVGKAFIYKPTREPKPMYRRIMENLRERIFRGSGIAMVASLFETKPPTADELDELEALLAALRKKQAKR